MSRMRNRILVVTNMYPNERDASEGIFVKETLDTLSQMGLDIDLLFVQGRRTVLKYAVGVLQLWWKLLQRRYDLIHAYYVYSGIVARMQSICPVVVTFCGSDVNLPSQRRFSKWLSGNVSKVIVQTQKMKELLGNADAVVLPFGVKLPLFAPIPQEQARSRLSLNSDARFALFPYNPTRKGKRYDLFDRAFRKAKEKEPRLEALIPRNVPRELVPLYMCAADVMVLTSESEGSPNTTKEALACGLPIVSVEVGDVADVIAGIEGNWICDGTEDAIAQGILRALSFGRRTRGRDRASELSNEAMASKLATLYAEILAGGRKVEK